MNSSLDLDSSPSPFPTVSPKVLKAPLTENQSDKYLGITTSKPKTNSMLEMLLKSVRKDGGIVIENVSSEGKNKGVRSIVIVTSQMSENYCLFADSLYWEPMHTHDDDSEEKVYALSVTDKMLKRRLAGIIIIREQTLEAYQEIVEQYFMELCQGLCPECVYIPSEEFLTEALVCLI